MGFPMCGDRSDLADRFIQPLLFLGALLGLLLLGRMWLTDPEVVLLTDTGEAHWIGHREPEGTIATRRAMNFAVFRARFRLDQDLPAPSISLHATHWAATWLDGRQIHQTHQEIGASADSDIAAWEQAYSLPLPPLAKGEHELLITVANYHGPPRLLVHGDGLHPGTVWESSGDGNAWLPTMAVPVNPAFARLQKATGAIWIGLNPAIPPNFVMPDSSRWFRRQFQTADFQESLPAELELICLRECRVWLDDQEQRLSGEGDWKQPRRLRLPPLASGGHELRLGLDNPAGPAALRLAGGGLASGPTWETSADGRDWQPAWLLSEFQSAGTGRLFPTGGQTLRMLAPLLLPALLLLTGLMWMSQRLPPWLYRLFRPEPFRLILLGLWFALGIHNLLRLPADFGYDLSQHLKYIRFVAQYHVLPLATDGWQMFQSPLYYLLSAGLYELLQPFLATDGLIRALRLIPLLCGALAIEIVFRAVRLLFPAEPGVQRLATLIGGFMPLSVYMSQSLGNEPLAGCLTGLTLFLALRLLTSPSEPAGGSMALLGLVWGLALLAKVTPILLAPVLIYVVWRAGRNRARPLSWTAGGIAWLFGTAILVSGWYYGNNWLELGRPFIGGWDEANGIRWWQPPGYRMAANLLTFGTALSAPIYSTMASFWDGIYSTLWLDGMLGGNQYQNAAILRELLPWHPLPLVASAWLSLLPTALILGGAFRQRHPAILVIIGCLALYLAALLQMYLRVPSYSVVKASYLLGLLPGLALLAAVGMSGLWKWPAARFALTLGIGCWWLTVYLAYWG